MPSLSEYWQDLAFALDDLGIYSSSAATGTTVTLPSLINSTPDASTNRYDGAWIWVFAGTGLGQQRQVQPGSYVPSTGTLTVTLGWTPPTSATVAITRLFPVTADLAGEDASYVVIVNRSLGMLVAPDRVSLAFANATSASTAGFPWLDTPERLIRVLEPAPVAGYPPVPCAWRGPTLILDGPTPVLQLNAPFTGTLLLDVLRPGDSLINNLESTTGFLSGQDTVTALPSVNDVTDVALAEAYWNLMNRTPGRPGVDWSKKWSAASEKAQSLRYYDRTHTRAQPAQPAVPQPAPEAA